MRTLTDVNKYFPIQPKRPHLSDARIGGEMKKQLDAVLSGEATRICEIDRRTFWEREKKGHIERLATVGGKGLYLRADVFKLRDRIRKERAEKKDK